MARKPNKNRVTVDRVLSARLYNAAVVALKSGHTWEAVIAATDDKISAADMRRLEGVADALGVERPIKHAGYPATPREEMDRRYNVLRTAARELGLSIATLPSVILRLKQAGYDTSASATADPNQVVNVGLDSLYNQREMERVDV